MNQMNMNPIIHPMQQQNMGTPQNQGMAPSPSAQPIQNQMNQMMPNNMPMVSNQMQPGSNPGPQMAQQGPPTVPSQEMVDNVTKARNLMGPLRDKFATILRSAAQVIQYNAIMDNGSLKGVESQPPRFEKTLEEFYSICDQIELSLKTAAICHQQFTQGSNYLPQAVVPTRLDPIMDGSNQLSYPQYLTTVRKQIAFAKEIHDTLICAALNVSMNNE